MLHNTGIRKCIILIVSVFVTTAFLCSSSVGQERAEKEKKEEKEEAFKPHSQLGLVIGHAHIFEGRDESGKKKTLDVPSWGIDYTYVFHPKWSIGLHTDIVIEKFKVEGEGGSVIERSYPIAPALMAIYKPGKRWSFLFGLGEEFAKEENLFLNRAGIEYGVELPKGWEVMGTLAYDVRWKAYDTWSIGMGISKRLGK